MIKDCIKFYDKYFIFICIYFFLTSSIASNGPGFGGGITSGILFTISGFIKETFSGNWYFAVFPTPYEIATTGLLSVLKASPIISRSI